MTAGDAPERRRPATLIVARRLDAMGEGSNSYLKPYLALCREAGFSTRLLFAPRRSFGNLPWARLHPDFAALVDRVDWPQSLRFRGLWLSLSARVWLRFLRRALVEVGRRLGPAAAEPYPSVLGYALSERESRAVARRAGGEPVELLTVEYSSLGQLLERVEARRRVVFLHDLFSLRASGFLALGKPPDHAVISLEDEAGRCRAADVLVHASCTELEQFAPQLPAAQHVWMPPEVISVPPRPATGFTPHGVFLGSQHAGNLHALDYLRSRVWPDVRASVPGAMLWVVGSICSRIDPAAAAEEGLRLLGRVDDLAEIAGEGAVGLAPMKFGSGVPIKVVDYLALGMPVVVTPGVLAPFGGALDGLVVESASEEEYPGEICKILRDSTIYREMSSKTRVLHARMTNDAVISAIKS